MDKHDRIQQIHRLLSPRRTPISVADLAEKLECSEKTVKRALENLRDICQAPLEYCNERKGWHYNEGDNGKFTLPGLWLTAEEIRGLAVILQITQGMDAGLLSDDIQLVEQAVEKLLLARHISPQAFKSKVHYLPKHRREAQGKTLPIIITGLLANTQLQITYADYAGRQTKRTISPIKLVHYDESWYLDAWCHLRQELRSFMLARIITISPTEAAAKKVPEQQCTAHFTSSYGIFAGQAAQTAELKFTGASAREAASYSWHPGQEAKWHDKTYFLNIPYNDDRELLRTLLGYGHEVEVLAPEELKTKLIARAQQIIKCYAGED
ncbi:MAG: YafY family transcriptional regulator [Hahellaceae bacterium]|nr:YafY family transcriptional regulator [Hahellaceae bacterium]MCP5212661.1 YafY family transcriptional regulator [Hahellaceae bacterium]